MPGAACHRLVSQRLCLQREGRVGARRALARAEPLLNISYVWKRFLFFDSFPPAHPTCISDPYKLSPARKSHRDAPHELDVTSRDPISIRFPSLLNPPRSANTDLSKPSTRPPCLISAPHATESIPPAILSSDLNRSSSEISTSSRNNAISDTLTVPALPEIARRTEPSKPSPRPLCLISAPHAT